MGGRTDVFTHHSICTRALSPERDRMRSGVSGVMAPGGGPSGARYSVVRRLGWALEGSTAVESDGFTAAPCAGVTGGVFELSESPAVTVVLTAASGSKDARFIQPWRCTCTQRAWVASCFRPKPFAR